MYRGRGSESRTGRWPSRGRKSYTFGSSHHLANSSQPATERPPSPPLGTLLDTITEADLLAVDSNAGPQGRDEKVGIIDCEYVASYGWLDRKKPTIIIPGMPPTWTPLRFPRKLSKDDGTYYRDPNSARLPSHPLAPATHALLSSRPTLDTRAVDLVACSSTLGNLLRFARRAIGDRGFRLRAQAVGGTVFFERRENEPDEVIEQVYGYGHRFADEYTTWGAEAAGSVAHQRVLMYQLGELNVVMRYGCDGYLPEKVPEDDEVAAETSHQEDTDDDDIADFLERARVSSATTYPGADSAKLHIEHRGRTIPQAAVFDLKTRSAFKEGLTVLKDELPRYWATQMPNFILAKHKGGVFDDITVQDIRAEVEEWERENQRDIRRLCQLIETIVERVMARVDKKLEVRCKNVEALELREQEDGEHDVLPPKLVMRWEGDHTSASESESESDESVGVASDELYEPGPLDSDSYSDDKSEPDYTACSAEDCGYCGHCSY